MVSRLSANARRWSMEAVQLLKAVQHQICERHTSDPFYRVNHWSPAQSCNTRLPTQGSAAMMYAVLLIQCTDRLGAGDLGTLCMYKPDSTDRSTPQGSLDIAPPDWLSNNPVALCACTQQWRVATQLDCICRLCLRAHSRVRGGSANLNGG